MRIVSDSTLCPTCGKSGHGMEFPIHRWETLCGECFRWAMAHKKRHPHKTICQVAKHMKRMVRRFGIDFHPGTMKVSSENYWWMEGHGVFGPSKRNGL
jgi:hypothetical protein